MGAKIDLTKYPADAGSLEIKAGLNGLLLLKKEPLRQRFIPNGKLVISGNTIIERSQEPGLYITENERTQRTISELKKKRKQDIKRWYDLRHPTREMKERELAKVSILIPFEKIPDNYPGPAKKQKKDKAPVFQVANTKKIRALVNTMSHALNYGLHNPWLSFVTITFEPEINDAMSKKLLNTWLTRCKQLNYFQLFLWRMEKQKNGTAHYHLVIVGKLNIQNANKVMVTALCSQVRKKKINIHISKAKRYNGVDLAKDRKNPDPAKRRNIINFADPKNAKRLSWYLSKYLTKSDEPGEGRQWACSREWSAFFTAISLSRKEAGILSRETGSIDLFPRFENEFCKFFRYINGPPDALCRMLGRVNFTVLMMYFTMDGNRFVKRVSPLQKINF